MSTFSEVKERNKNKEYAYQYYLKKGYRPIEAAAIVGNLDIESGGFSSDVIQGKRRGDNNTAFGAAQWRHERQDRLRSRYKDPNNLDNQLDFVDWELNNTHRSALTKMRRANSVEEATSAFTWDYERPNKKYAHFDKRLNSAASLLGENAESSEVSYNQDSVEPTKTLSTYITPTPGELETSETEYVEEDTKEVAQAKQDLTEKSFIEDFRNTIDRQQQQIQELQNSLRPTEHAQQQEEQFVLDEMPDPYNYIQLNSGLEEFQRGGIIATRQDSLDVYNNSRKVEKYYENRKYEPAGSVIAYNIDNIFKENDEAYKLYDGDAAIVDSEGIMQRMRGISKKEYRQKIDDNKYKQREHAVNTLNGSAPMQLFDKRIKPRDAVAYMSEKGNDFVDIPTYNNIATKPFDMLTEKEKEERVKKYGRQGVPESYKKVTSRFEPKKIDKVVKYRKEPVQIRNEQDILSLNPVGIQSQEQLIQGTEPTIRNQAQIPNSYNVNYSAQRMNDGRGYYDQNNQQNVDLETALRAKSQADRANQYWQEKYRNSLNPNAIERLNTLRDEAIITPNYEVGGIIEDDRGQWAYPGEVTKISSGDITMQGVGYPVYGVDNLGNAQMMYPNQNYKFPGTSVTEYPQNRKRITKRFSK